MHAKASFKLVDLPLPVAVVRNSALTHNVQAMAAWTRRHGFELAPHGKTTMCTQIFRRQLEAGAWGLTAATSAQAIVCFSAGADRVLIANQLVTAANIKELKDYLAAHDHTQLYCVVDSVEGLRLIHQHWRGARRPLGVLIEIGQDGWRTGARSFEAASGIYAALLQCSPELQFAGLEAFEGSAPTAIEAEQFVLFMIDIARRFPPSGDRRIFSIGGSAYLAVLARTLPGLASGWTPLLRSGCYVTHDHGIYEQRQIESRGHDVPEFRPALELWAAVQSLPEPGLAIVGFGKRNASYDLGLPTPLDFPGCSITRLNDQHAFMACPADTPLRVGDAVRFGISHPCTTFDKWREMLLVDDDYNILESLETSF